VLYTSVYIGLYFPANEQKKEKAILHEVICFAHETDADSFW